MSLMRPPLPDEPLRMPAWYARKCRAVGRAFVNGHVTLGESVYLIEVWHPVALGEASRVWERLNEWRDGRDGR
jgi:hypothetical protein